MATLVGPLCLESSGQVIVEQLEVADGVWSRFWGWQGRCEPVGPCGLLLIPCRSIHTCWMRFPLDVAELDAHGGIVAWHAGVAPWRILVGQRATRAMLELPAGRIQLSVGEQVRLPSTVGLPLPASVRFLSVGTPR